MFPLPAAKTYEEGLPKKTGILGFRDRAVPISCGTGADIVYSSTPQYGLEEPVSVPGSCTGASRYTGRPEELDYGPRQRTGPIGRDVGIQGRVYAITPPTDLADQPVIKG